MSSPDPVAQDVGTDDGAADPVVQNIRLANAALVRKGSIPVVVLGLALVVGWTVAGGLDGFLGALVGLVIVGAFYGSDVALMRRTADLVPVAVFAVMLMAFTLKLTLLGVFLVLAKDTTAFSVPAFGVTVIALTVVGLAVAAWLSARTTVTVDPEATAPPSLLGPES